MYLRAALVGVGGRELDTSSAGTPESAATLRGLAARTAVAVPRKSIFASDFPLGSSQERRLRGRMGCIFKSTHFTVLVDDDFRIHVPLEELSEVEFGWNKELEEEALHGLFFVSSCLLSPPLSFSSLPFSRTFPGPFHP